MQVVAVATEDAVDTQVVQVVVLQEEAALGGLLDSVAAVVVDQVHLDQMAGLVFV
jgi:BioD-like phosphotransacetylase family protein